MHEPASEHPLPPQGGVDGDIRLPYIFGFGLGFFLLVVGAMGLMWLLLGFLTQRNEKQNPSAFPLAKDRQALPLEEKLPPAPRLEGLDLREPIRSGVPGWPSMAPLLARQQQEQLESFGWVDEEKGIVHIPIAEAMKRLAGKLPSRKGEVAPAGRNGFKRGAGGESSGQPPSGESQ